MSFIASQYLPTSDSSGGKPTFFEIVAHEQILPGLKSASRYVLSLFAQSNFSLLPFLKYHDEIFLVFQLLTEHHYLENYDATFSEYLYNMKRVRTAPCKLWQSHYVSLLFSVVLPYFKQKIHAYYLELNEEQSDGANATWTAQAPQQHSTPATPAALGVRHFFSSPRFQYYFKKYWPYLNGTIEAFFFVYLLGYLFEDWKYHSPLFATQRLHLQRLTMHDLIQHKNNLIRKRVATIANLRNHTRYTILYKTLEYSIRLMYKVSDYSRALLLFLVFLFKFFEWYYASEHLRAPHKNVFIPDAPPKPPRCNNPARLPANNNLCPICKQERTNPTLLTKSGFVFCYKCIHRYLQEENACPVTALPATQKHLRRLFE
mmetsp:Transcript_6951/g.25988  ORF Transcript_6951/g.25988 Transcript_6951/m.25988 type:complete len:373 (+) Transcript_6951:1-1119(+)